MKRNIAYMACSGLVALAILLTGLWLSERRNLSQVEQLAQSGAMTALNLFEEYRDTGEESCYWYAVAEFRLFQQAYGVLVEGTNKRANYTSCNVVYGYLVINPERSQAHIDEIIDVLTMLTGDIEAEAGYAAMGELGNSIATRGEVSAN